jgi:hypothetical protein
MAFLDSVFSPLDYAPAGIKEASYARPAGYLVTGMRNVACSEGPASAVSATGILLCLAALLTI